MQPSHFGLGLRIPLSRQGDYDGWFCQCYGSQYDIAGRVSAFALLSAYQFLAAKDPDRMMSFRVTDAAVGLPQPVFHPTEHQSLA